MSKKLLALLLALVMIVGSFTSVLADTATDKKAEEPAKTEEKAEEKKDEKSEEPAKTEEKTEEKKEEEPVKTEDPALTRAITVLKKAGFITGYSADSDDFKVEKNVKRSEFASMIVRAMGLEKSAKSLATVPTGFKDVPTNHWANGYIAVAKQQGFVNGYTDGTFRPDRQISYQDMATMLTIALGQAEVGTVYPAGYIVKAQQLGLFNDVNVPAYTDMATRGDVFKMLYNMINCKEFGSRKIVKAIVLENNRVENLGDREVTVEVIDIVQEANWADASRTKKGQQYKYVLDKELKLDVEQLLGKVVDITTDKDGNIVEVKQDDTYDYLEGKVTEVNRKKIGIDRTDYSVGFDERYDERDERIFRTYLNNRNYSYRDFAEKYNSKKYDFARVTMKNGKVIFIDAYQFDDVAPVTDVKDGAVYYRDDARQANEFKAAALGNRVIFHDKAGYSVAERKDIAKDDVIHFYNDYEDAIVRKDAKVETNLVKTHRDAWSDEWVVGKDAEYRLNKNHPFKAIFSMEGKYYKVVEDRSSLEPIIKDDVKILLALDDTVQLVESAKAWKDGVHAVKKVYSKGEVLLLPPMGEAFWATETRDTRYENYLVEGNVNNRKLMDYEFDDIVYYSGNDKNEIVRMGVLVKKYAEDTKGNKIGYAQRMQNTSMTPRYITSGTKDYRYFSGLKAFYLDKYNRLQQITDWDTFYAYNKKNEDLQSYVISELALKNALGKNYIKTYNFLSDADDIANVVIFNKVVETKYDPLYAEVTDLWYSTDEARFVDAKGNVYLVELDKYPVKFDEGDIVELQLDKASKAKKEETVVGHVSNVVIYAGDDTVKIEQQRPTNTYKVTHNNGIEETVYFDGDTNEFGRQSTDYAQIYTEKDSKTGKTFVVVIRYRRGPKGTAADKYASYATLDDANYAEIVLNGQRVPVTADTLYIDGSNQEFGRKGLAYIIPYIGGKVKVTKTSDGRIAAVEGIAKADTVLVDKVVAAIEAFGDVEAVTSSAAPTPAEQKVLEDKIKDYLEKNKIPAALKATTAYVAAVTDSTGAITTPEHFKTTVKFGSVSKDAINGIKRVAATPVPTAQQVADELYKAIEELRDKTTPVKAIDEKTKNVDDTKVLASVKEKLQLAIDDETLATKYPLLAGLDLTKVKINGTITPNKVDAKTKEGTYNVKFEYDGTPATDASVIDLTTIK